LQASWKIEAPGTPQDRFILTTQFSQFPLSPALQARLDANSFVIPTPVQDGAIPPALEGRDVLATAQTGTGKTLSFLIPIIEMLQKTPDRNAAQALILLPTRELAMQVEVAFKAIRTSPLQTAALVVGGMQERPQLDAIRRGARLIVATPGRLEDYLKRGLVRMDQVKILVLDEVDRMLDMGFQPAIARIVATLPARQTLCYSATLEGAIQEVARKYLNSPARIEIGSVLKPADNVELRTFEVEQNNKQELLEHLLGAEQGSFLVFVRTKHGADRVARRLTRSGWAATQIHGDRSQAQRNAALRSFKEGHHRVLVATDVAARGIDVANVAHVVNFDVPKVAEDFVHRVGRTGRASASGVASTFAAAAERGELRKIERTLSIRMKRFKVRSMNETAA
jgi:ATP-dependent RNA helicase RhlE